MSNLILPGDRIGGLFNANVVTVRHWSQLISAPAVPLFLEAVNAPCVEREPWRMLRSSLRIQFRPRKAADFDDLDAALKVEIVAALEAVQSVHNAFSKVKSALFDLVFAAKRYPHYARALASHGAGAKEVQACVRGLASMAGPLWAHREDILEVLRHLNAAESELDLFVDGFTEVRERLSGKICFRFEHLGKRRRMGPAEVQFEAAAYTRLLAAALEVFATANRQMSFPGSWAD